LSDFLEFDGNVGSVTIQNGSVSVLNGTGVVKNDNLGQEGFSFSGGVSLGIRGDVSSFNFFNGNVFNVESDVVSWNGFSELFVVHFD